MVATNDDLLAELQQQTVQMKKIKRLIKGFYSDKDFAVAVENDNNL